MHKPIPRLRVVCKLKTIIIFSYVWLRKWWYCNRNLGRQWCHSLILDG